MFTYGGFVGMWDPDNPYTYEENPWRAYEPVMWKLGHFRTYLHFLLYYYYESAKFFMGIDVPLLKTLSGIKPIKYQLFPEIGSTDNPDVATLNPQLTLVNKITKPFTSLTLFHDFWGTSGIMLLRDNLKRPIKSFLEDKPLINFYDGDGKVTVSPRSGSHLTQKNYNSIEFDDSLENLHSCGINTISCLPANTYLHLTWIRHGSTYQIIDPWTTTDWSASWTQLLIKRFALGDTIGEAYEKGMRATGPELLVEQWWWDIWENVCLFGDPNLRVYVPNTEFSDKNNWEEPDLLKYDKELNLQGHSPYGSIYHPHEREPEDDNQILFILLILIILIVIFFAIATSLRKKK
jgi:hypothetical protein